MINNLFRSNRLLANRTVYRTIITDFKNLVEMQEKSCLEHANRPLFGTNSPNINWMTYQEWDNNISLFRKMLHNININYGDRVSIISNNKIEWAVSAYATYSIGGIFVPMYQNQLEKDWKYILNDSKSNVLICTNKETFKKCKNFLNEIKHLKNIILLEDNYSDLYQNIKCAEYKSIYPNEDDLATIIYTSGTTANPKGVELTHKNIVSNIKGIRNSFSDFSKICNENDRSISFLPWAHSYGQTCELHSTISTGSSMYLSEGIDKLIDEINIVKPTLLFSVPALFNKIYDNINSNIKTSKIKSIILDDALKTSNKIRNKDNSIIDTYKYNFYNKHLFSKIKEKLGGNIKLAFVGGAATPLEVLNFFENINIPIIEGYGLTETSPIITLGTNEYPDRKVGSVGKLLPENEIIVLSENEDILDNNMIGEICAYGPNIMNSYHNKPEENKKSFLFKNGKRYFRTGDIGYLDSENRLYIKGRIKEQYKLENGKFVIPTLLEDAIITSPYIKQIMIHGENRPYNIALIVPNYDTLDDNLKNDKNKLYQLYQSEINLYLKKNNIKSYEIPRYIIILSEEFSLLNGLLTPKLSIKRNQVLEKYNKVINTTYLNKLNTIG